MKSLNKLQVELNRQRFFCAALALLIVVAPVPAALGVDVPTLYTANVPFDQESENAREDAYKAALVAVLARVSGSQLSDNDRAVDELFPVPAAYVTQFRPGDEDTLWVSFDDQAIERILKNAGQTVWGRDRPLTLVWLAVDWGNGNREIIAAGDPQRTQRQGRSIDRNRLLRERVLAIAQRRGLPVAFPLMDTTDLQSVTFSDIWGGFDERIVAASRRYEANSVLIGRIQPSRSQRDRWTYIFSGQSRSWSGEAEQVIAQIADQLATEFAVGGNAPLELMALNVAGLGSIDAFGSLQKSLSEVGLIERVVITSVTGDVVRYELEARGGAERLRRALRFAGLIPSEATDRPYDPDALPTLDFYFAAEGIDR